MRRYYISKSSIGYVLEVRWNDQNGKDMFFKKFYFKKLQSALDTLLREETEFISPVTK